MLPQMMPMPWIFFFFNLFFVFFSVYFLFSFLFISHKGYNCYTMKFKSFNLPW